MALSRRSKRWLIFIAVLATVVLALRLGRNELAAGALRSVVQVTEKAGHRITFGAVNMSLVGGHIRISDLDVTPLSDSTVEDSAVRYTLHADAIDLSGVDIWALLRQRVLHVGHVELHAPSVTHSFITREIPPAKKEKAPPDTTRTHGPLELIHVDTLLISDATGRSQDRLQTRAAMSVADLDLLITGISVRQDAEGRPMPDIQRIELALHQAEVRLKPYYTLSIDSMRVSVPEDTAAVFGVHFTPDVSPKDYHKHVKLQVELYKATVDTLMLVGFDLAGKLQEGAIRAKALYVAGVAVDIHRDKSLPLPEKEKFKPLAADLVTSWKMPISVDTITVRRGSVTYHERLKLADDYGSLAFTDISGGLTGLSNEPAAHPVDLHLAGTARVGRSRAQLDLRMPMQATHTTVTTHVLLHDFPAKEMNRMTDDLLHVNATAGIIHMVEMRMHGDEDAASGTLDMRYEDLALEINPTIKHAKIFSALANTVVRGANMPGTKGYRVGHFTVKRHTESGVFNYIWISLREGMMDVVLPPMVLKQLKKKAK